MHRERAVNGGARWGQALGRPTLLTCLRPSRKGFSPGARNVPMGGRPPSLWAPRPARFNVSPAGQLREAHGTPTDTFSGQVASQPSGSPPPASPDDGPIVTALPFSLFLLFFLVLSFLPLRVVRRFVPIPFARPHDHHVPRRPAPRLQLEPCDPFLLLLISRILHPRYAMDRADILDP